MSTTRNDMQRYYFENKINTALRTVKRLLDSNLTRPVAASQCHHKYDDKFALTEQVTTMAVASWLNMFELIGAPHSSSVQDALVSLSSAARAGKRVSIKIASKETCKLLHSATREEAADTKVQTSSTLFGNSTTQVIRTVHEWVWQIEHTYSVTAYTTKDSEELRLLHHQATTQVTTHAERPPLPEHHAPTDTEADITWLLKQLAPPTDASSRPRLAIAIDRSDASCVTPRRNATVDAALEAASELRGVATRLEGLFNFGKRVLSLDVSQPSRQLLPPLTGGAPLFVPVLPLLRSPSSDGGGGADAITTEQPDDTSDARSDVSLIDLEPETPAAAAAVTGAEPPASGSSLSITLGASPATSTTAVASDASAPLLTLGLAAVEALLAEEKRTLMERRQMLTRAYGDEAASVAGTLLSPREAWLATLGTHTKAVIVQLEEAVAYVESLLRSQLVDAIGKSLTHDDFASYFALHTKKLLRPAYLPQPFSYAVRQPDRSPEGTVSIERRAAGVEAPVETFVRKMAEPAPPMSFALDAATRVTFHGERYLHAFVDHAFGHGIATSARRSQHTAQHTAPRALTLAMRARQFSSFLVVIGRLGPGGTLEAQHALLVRNKDDLRVPLLLEQMPSAQEFHDAISSLSPEQQRFARQMRALQLEGSVFGVLIVQLKPQLERLLRLPADSLIKEIALTQRLLELFIDFQIPSDLLAYDGPEDAPASEKLAAVRAHVKAIDDTVDAAKQAEIDEVAKQHAYLHPEADEMMGGGMMEMSVDPWSVGGGFAQASGFPPGDTHGGTGGGGKGGGERSCMRSARRSAGGMGARPPMACGALAPPPLAPPPLPCAAAQQTMAMNKSCAAPPMPASAPAPPGGTASTTSSNHNTPQYEDDETVDVGGSIELDFTRLPGTLDTRLADMDEDNAMRPTKIVVPTDGWRKTSQAALLAKKPTTSTLSAADQDQEKQRAFDLLDGLSRSGALPIDCCALHVVIAVTHCFDDSLLDTVIVRNVNPIEKLERSCLIVSEVVHGVEAPSLVRADAYERVATYSAPMLLPPVAADNATK